MANILISGVGGQGTLLASRVLGKYALLSGKDCKLSEIHGMSQRGGSVVTYVKYGDKVYSPVVGLGEADIILANINKEAARLIRKVLTSATANAENNLGLKKENLKVSQAFIDEGLVMKRMKFGSRGHVDPIKRRRSHITVVVSDEL